MTFALFVVPALASAEPPPEADESAAIRLEAESIVTKRLLEPLAAKEAARSRFSRARLPPQERRVRVLDAEPVKDEKGVAFLSFAVDARHGFEVGDEADERTWRKDAMAGCVYLETEEVFLKRGDGYHPAAFMLGKKTKAAAEHVCRAQKAQVASAK